jgi:hypothetical protein
MALGFAAVLSFIVGMASACNNYVEGASNTYLCMDQTCSLNVDCQSNCCWQNVCSKSECGQHQFNLSLILISIFSALLAITYVALHFLYCKAKNAKIQAEIDGQAQQLL